MLSLGPETCRAGLCSAAGEGIAASDASAAPEDMWFR